MNDPQKPRLEAIYGPSLNKTFKSALSSFIHKEFPQMGGSLVVELFVDQVEKMVTKFFPPVTHLKMGQVLWFSVAKEEQHCYAKPMSRTRILPTILSLITSEDINRRIDGVPLPEIRKKIAARLCQQAFEQGAVLSQTDIALLTLMNEGSIAKAIKEYQQENNCTLPYRGTVHDMGPSVSHKGQICKKRLVEKKSVSQTAQETYHSHKAIRRYETDLNRVIFCLAKGLSIQDTSFVTSLSKSLIIEYQNLGQQIHNMKTAGEENFDDLPF